MTGSSEAYEAAARAFEVQHPGWRVRIGFLGMQKPAGCVALPLEKGTITTAIGLGLLRDLEPFLEADPDIGRDRFLAQALAVSRWQGRTYALPGSLRSPLLRYNSAIFDELGMTRPDASWDMELQVRNCMLPTWKAWIKRAQGRSQKRYKLGPYGGSSKP